MYLPGRQLHWAVLAFLSAFALILVMLGWFYLIPTAAAMQHADTTQRLWLRDTSRLLLAVILFVLISILILSFRIGRFFIPRPTDRPTRTRYIDAWSEAGKRMPTPPPDDQNN